MDKREMITDMKSEIGSFPNKSQIARYLGWSRSRVRNLVEGLPSLDGKNSQYFVSDVVEKLWERRR